MHKWCVETDPLKSTELNHVALHRSLGITAIYITTLFHSECRFIHRGKYVVSFTSYIIAAGVCKEGFVKTTFHKISPEGQKRLFI